MNVERPPYLSRLCRTELCPVQITRSNPTKSPTPTTIASQRLAKLASMINMGGGPDTRQEHLLIVLPVSVPSYIIERIEKRHPNIKVTFKSTLLTDTPWKGVEDIPRGQLAKD